VTVPDTRHAREDRQRWSMGQSGHFGAVVRTLLQFVREICTEPFPEGATETPSATLFRHLPFVPVR
jgi:hypothetical protein